MRVKDGFGDFSITGSKISADGSLYSYHAMYDSVRTTICVDRRHKKLFRGCDFHHTAVLCNNTLLTPSSLFPMDFASMTVPQLRSILNSDGVVMPQVYLKKADLVELCQKHFGKSGPPSRTSPVPKIRGRSDSRSPRISLSPEPVVRSKPTSARRKSSMGTKGNRPTSPARDALTSPVRTPARVLDVSDIQDFRRTPSPEPQASGKTFSGRPSLANSGRTISIAPLSTLPPRPKSFGRKPKPSAGSPVLKILGLLVAFAAIGVTWLYTQSSASPRVPLCNTDGSPHVANTTCAFCPKIGTCANGFLTSCTEHYIAHGDQCVRDEAKFFNAVAMVEALAARLVSLKGQKDCGDEVSDTVYPEQLRVMLRVDFKRLSDDQFRSAFELALNGGRDDVVLPNYIVTTPLGLMRSSYGRKSITCQVREWVQEWLLTILVLSVTIAYSTVKLTVWKKKRNMTKSLLHAIETNTKYRDGRVQGLSVLDLRDKDMALHHLDDKAARKAMATLLKAYPDVQCGEDVSRAGETIYWSSHRLRAEQASQNH